MFNPNFLDPRVHSRCRRALAFVQSRFNQQPRAWSTRDIDRYFTQQQNPLSQWLRQKLLVEVNGYYNSQTGKCKEYVTNIQGLTELKQQLKLDNDQYVVQELEQEFHKELDSLEFEYLDKSNRLWNPIQNIRREFKLPLLASAGLKYNYDIEAAAPTLIRQLANYRGFIGSTPCIDEYLRDRTQVRQQLSKDTGTSEKQIKQVINAMFCGARISHWTKSSIFMIVDENHYLIDQLKQHPWINELKEEIKCLWNDIFKNERTRDFDGILVRINSKDRWQVYFEQERVVLDSIRRYLRKKQIKALLEHDGFTTNQAVNIDELEDRIRQETNFLVRLSVEITPCNIDTIHTNTHSVLQV
jgi:hypothetical protein